MVTMRSMLMIVACLSAFAAPASAQSFDSNDLFGGGVPRVKKPKPGLPEVKAQPLAWPRLDPGAVLCRSEADLMRLAQRRSGEVADGPVDCQVVRVAIGITIVQRKGGRTEVKPSDAQPMESGWTDAYLPQKAPPVVTSATRQIPVGPSRLQ
jgi:hypothetical protein